MRQPPTPASGDRHDASNPTLAASAALLGRCTYPEPGTVVTCALSGGPDSSALVALAVIAGCEVSAVHIDHGTRSTSTVDADRAADIARVLGVPFRCERVVVDDGPNYEARARDARRSVLGRDALTGHTADDQAETVLLALLRGAGATGLAGMTPGPTKPLLQLRRRETHALCETLRLDVAVDPTNLDMRFRRNRVRHELLPLLDDIAQRDTADLLIRTAEFLRSDDELLTQMACDIDPTDALAITAAPRPLAVRALRSWLSIDGYPPDAAAIDRVLAVASGAAVGCEITGGRRVQRSQQRLQLFSERPVVR